MRTLTDQGVGVIIIRSDSLPDCRCQCIRVRLASESYGSDPYDVPLVGFCTKQGLQEKKACRTLAYKTIVISFTVSFPCMTKKLEAHTLNHDAGIILACEGI